MDIQQLLPLIKKAALEAGSEILEVYNSADPVDVDYKSDSSPLTTADRRSNDVINRRLSELETGWLLVSEENREIPYAKRWKAEKVWMVDPLDGTKEFIKRNGEFTVNIALLENGSPILGVVYIPVKGELYWAVRGQGAWLQAGGEKQRLQARPFRMEQPGLRVVCSRSHLNERTKEFISQLSNPSLLQRGSSLKFLSIAKGEADLYPRLAPTMEWDTAAAQIIVEEAGGTVLQHPKGGPVRYNKEDLLNPHFVVMGKLLES